MKTDPKLLAETLVAELIQRKHCDIPSGVSFAPAAVPALEGKIRLYQFTSILLAVITAARTKPEFIPVQEHLERHFFPPKLQEGVDILLDVRQAMNDLSELLTPKDEDRAIPSSKAGKSMLWARSWLLGIGVEENNPATLALFALEWMDYYVMVTDSLKEFNPVA